MRHKILFWFGIILVLATLSFSPGCGGSGGSGSSTSSGSSSGTVSGSVD